MNSRARFFSIFKNFWVQLFGIIGLFATAVTGADSIANAWHKYFDKPSELVVLDQAVNLPSVRPVNNNGVLLELVQAPTRQNTDQLVFDVYLQNESAKDLLLTSVSYDGGAPYYASSNMGSDVSATTYSHPFAPDSSYKIQVSKLLKGDAALSPPYLLKRKSRAAIRFRFAIEGLSRLHAEDISFSVFDSRGRKIATVNGK